MRFTIVPSGSGIFLVCLVIAAFLVTCSRPRPEMPPGILKEKEVIPVLIDIHIAHAAADLYGQSDSLRYSMNEYLPYILKIHQVERAVYDSSISFYMRYPELMQEMYEEVINELSRKQGEVQADKNTL